MKQLLAKGMTLLVATILILTFTACNTTTSNITEKNAIISSDDEQNTTTNNAETNKSVSDQWDDTATMITLSDTEIVIDGEGAKATGSILTISSGGVYVVSGTLNNGQIVVSAPKTTDVQLVLNGVNITSDTNSAIYCAQANNLLITLAENSENILTDATTYTYADVAKEEPDAALFSKVDLTLNGTGSLTINGNFNNGIGTKDDLIIIDGTYDVTAVNHAVRGRDSVTVLDGDLTLTAGNDGIQSNNDEDVSKGWINLQGGTYQIDTEHDGIQAETTLAIAAGEFHIMTGGGSDNTNNLTDDGSYKGIKASKSIEIVGGTFVINSADDGIHSNADITISNGDFQISSGDDGIHADGNLDILDGTIDILKSYEGLESSTMTIAGGTHSVVASDDGINIAGGNDDSEETTPKPFGGDSFATTNKRWLNITGGTTVIDSSADGLDANGNITMSGGTVLINGPTGSGDGALDFDGTFDITGGTLIAAGSAGMTETPSDSSTQPSLAIVFSEAKSAGQTIAVTTSLGEEIVSFAPTKSFQSIVISEPTLAEGDTYMVTIDGERILEVTLSDAITVINDSGEATTLGRGGPGGGPGGTRGENFGERPPMQNRF